MRKGSGRSAAEQTPGPLRRANEDMMLSFIRSQYRLVAAESYESDRSGQSHVFQNNLVGTVEDGKVLRAWGTQRDITERKHMLEALKESETRCAHCSTTASSRSSWSTASTISERSIGSPPN